MTATARRVLSVLFADLVGFTTLAERLDSEDLAIIQNEYFARARAVIGAHGGVVEKFIGDAVVGTFGVRVSRHDDAVQAVGAGMAIVSAVEKAGVSLGLGPDALLVRVGINTGEVHVRFAEDGSWQLTGDTVNVASRLQSVADPGSVLVGADTALALEAEFAIEPAGKLRLKGKDDAVAAWRVIGQREVPSRSLATRGLEAPLMGRHEELRVLDDALRRADDRQEAWLVVAPPGVGRSRLVREWATRASARGSEVSISAVPDEGVSAYEPVAQLLRGALGPGLDSPQARQLIRQRLERHALGGRRADVAADHVLALVRGEPPVASPTDLYESWIAVLDAHEIGRPSVWIIEDLHLAPPDLIAFLRRSLEEGGERGGRMLVLTTVPSLLARLRADPLPALQTFHLGPLGRSAMRALVEAILAPGVLPRKVIDGIAAASGGNALFVEELLRAWIQAGVLQEQEGRWRFVSAERDLRLPTTVRAVYQGQLDTLPGTPRTVVTLGSVAGRTFPAPALPSLGVETAAGSLEQLTMLGLLAGPHLGFGDVHAYTYRHALLRDVAYATLPRAERARLHLRFARWVEGATAGPLGPDEMAGADEIVGLQLAAAHASAPRLSGEVDVAVSKEEVAERASARLERAAAAQLAGEPQRAAQLLERALELTPPERHDERRRRRLRLGESLRRSGRLEEAMDAFAEAGDADGDKMVDAWILVEAALGYEDALFASRLPRRELGARGLRLLTAALSALEETEDAQRARVLAALGRAHVYGDRPEEGARACAEAVKLGRAAHDDAALAYALLALRATYTSPASLATRLSGAGELIEAAHRAGDHETELEGRRLRFIDLMESGEVEAARDERRHAEELIARLGRPLHLWYPAMWSAMEALFTGDLEAAEELVENFRLEGERWHYRDVALVHAVQALHLRVDRGIPEAALPLLERLYGSNPQRWSPVLAFGYAEAGLLDAARERFEVHASTGFTTLAPDLSWTYVAALSVECAARLEDVAAARSLWELLGPWAGHSVVLGSGAAFLGAGSHFVGVAATAAGDPAAAVPLLEDAATRNSTMGARPAAARSRAELARALLLVDRGDEAAGCVAEARAEARRLGMVGLVERLDGISGRGAHP